MSRIKILENQLKVLRKKLKQERSKDKELSFYSRIRMRIMRLTRRRDAIVDNSTMVELSKPIPKLIDIEARIEELGKLLDKRGHKLKT